LPDKIEQIAVLAFGSKRRHSTLAGGKLLLVEELIEEIFTELKDKRLASSAIPEHLSILRSFQFATEFRNTIVKVWQSAPKGGG
jgi:hypothetical protein